MNEPSNECKAEKQENERQMRDAWPVCILPIQWTANPEVQEVISKHKELTNFKEVSLIHIYNPSGQFHQCIDSNYKISCQGKRILKTRQICDKKNMWQQSNI